MAVLSLKSVAPHSNVDRLEIATCASMSYQFVVLKGKHTVGDQALYFPVDGLLLETRIEKRGLRGRLSGAVCNRVKTVKLRVQLSQGLVEFPEDTWERVRAMLLSRYNASARFIPHHKRLL
jgi:RNA ligase (TIGR02306 family)